MSNHRQSTLRRNVNEFIGLREGGYEESKLWTNAGKAASFYILLAYADALILHEWALAIILTALIAPELFKKALLMRQQNGAKPPQAGS